MAFTPLHSDIPMRSINSKTIHDIVPSALAAVRKVIQVDLPYESVPAAQLQTSSSSLNLSQWSIIVTDECLATIATRQQLSLPRPLLTSINLSGAEKITDAGIQSLSPCIATLQTLQLDNAYQISSDGLSIIAKYGKNLRHLSLAGCLKIDGVGFAVIGEGCRAVQHLNLGGCRQVKPWAFMKIFESCTQIETLDVSYCSMITDNEIKILSESSRGLRRINLRECKLVSDVGLTFLSQGCPNLMEINLRRSEMPFRITDVALLQLGQGCQSLVSINLRGCEMISDSGLSWISSWLKDLKHIDLSQCSKITERGKLSLFLLSHLAVLCYHSNWIIPLQITFDCRYEAVERRMQESSVYCAIECKTDRRRRDSTPRNRVLSS